jgi:hypothetical protein
VVTLIQSIEMLLCSATRLKKTMNDIMNTDKTSSMPILLVLRAFSVATIYFSFRVSA